MGAQANQEALNSKSAADPGKAAALSDKTVSTLNHVLCDTLPVECGITRAMLRSRTKAGTVKITARAKGMADATLSLTTHAVDVNDGLSTYMPSDGLKCVLSRGETPRTPSFTPSRKEIAIIKAVAGSGNDVRQSFDTYENTDWTSSPQLDSAWLTYTLRAQRRI